MQWAGVWVLSTAFECGQEETGYLSGARGVAIQVEKTPGVESTMFMMSACIDFPLPSSPTEIDLAPKEVLKLLHDAKQQGLEAYFTRMETSGPSGTTRLPFGRVVVGMWHCHLPTVQEKLQPRLQTFFMQAGLALSSALGTPTQVPTPARRPLLPLRCRA